jgi:hypothetical protein
MKRVEVIRRIEFPMVWVIVGLGSSEQVFLVYGIENTCDLGSLPLAVLFVYTVCTFAVN